MKFQITSRLENEYSDSGTTQRWKNDKRVYRWQLVDNDQTLCSSDKFYLSLRACIMSIDAIREAFTITPTESYEHIRS